MAAFGLPVLASVAVVQLLTLLTGIPTRSFWVFLAWWLGVTLVASFAVSVLYSVTKRLLPLGGLLGLSLVFPDRAPSRFRIALAAGTVESLQGRLKRMRDRGDEVNAQEAAEILLQLVAALDVHDRITRGHAERVRGYAAGLGRELGLSRDDLDRLNWSALLHDVGKLEVEAEILNKPGRPTDEDWEKLRRHPLDGELLVAPLRGWLGQWIDAVGCHHENWDGSGYPRGTAGEAIPLAGRIVAIADVYDVITSARSYKDAATPAEARAELVRCSGVQFDPRLVRAFVGISLGRARLVAGPLTWLSNAPLLIRVPLAPSLGATIGGVAALATAATASPAVTRQPEFTRPSPVAQAAPRMIPVAVHNPAPVAVASAPVRRHRLRHASSHSHPGRTHAAPRIVTTPRKKAPKRPPVGTAKPAPPPAPAPPPPSTTATTTTATAAPPKPTPKPTPTPTPPTTTAPAPKPPPTTTAPAPPPTTGPLPPPANVAPTFTAGGSQSVLEDAGAQTVPGWATAISPGSGAEASQTVTFTVSTDNTSLFSAAPAVAPDGTLTFTPAADANGSAHVSVVAVDNGGTANGGHDTSASRDFTITVAAVNDAPTFTPGGNQTAVSLLGAQAVSGWANAISPGPADESAQTVGFTVTVSNPSLFAVQPAISSNGTLTYKPKALVLGSATVTVTAVDSGGTDSGGQNTGAPRTFTITIL